MVSSALLAGMLAGLGIAVPVGAIAILILDIGARRGFRAAFAAGTGAASADLLYAGLAAFAGAPVAAALAPVRVPLQLLSATALLALATLGVRRALHARQRRAVPPSTGGLPPLQLAAGLFGLTLLNPLTVTYFAAVVLGLPPDALVGTPARASFVAGAVGASWAWQSLLAAVGAFLHGRATPRARLATGLAGSLLVAALGVRVLLTAVSA